MQIRIHEAYRSIVAVCDTNLLGEVFQEGIKQLEVKPSFFKGEEKTKEEIKKILRNMAKEDATFNIVGPESIETALESEIISKKGIITIEGIPVALGLM